MGRNKQLRKVIAGKLANIQDHEDKIEQELKKSAPDYNLIKKWNRDIESFEREVAKYSAKLPGRKNI